MTFTWKDWLAAATNAVVTSLGSGLGVGAAAMIAQCKGSTDPSCYQNGWMGPAIVGGLAAATTLAAHIRRTPTEARTSRVLQQRVSRFDRQKR